MIHQCTSQITTEMASKTTSHTEIPKTSTETSESSERTKLTTTINTSTSTIKSSSHSITTDTIHTTTETPTIKTTVESTSESTTAKPTSESTTVPTTSSSTTAEPTSESTSVEPTFKSTSVEPTAKTTPEETSPTSTESCPTTKTTITPIPLEGCNYLFSVSKETSSIDVETDVTYDTNAPCTWNFAFDDFSSMVLKFLKFNLEKADILILYQGDDDDDDNNPLIWSMSAADQNQLNNVYVLKNNSKLVFLPSLEKYEKEPFELKISGQYHGGVFGANGKNISCDPKVSDTGESYYLVYTTSSAVMVQITEFPSNANIFFYDGILKSNNPIAKMASTEDSYNVFSISNMMLINVQYEPKSNECIQGKIMQSLPESNQLSTKMSDSYQIKSDAASNDYVWIVKPDQLSDDKVIVFTIETFNPDEGLLTIHDGLADNAPMLFNMSFNTVERTLYFENPVKVMFTKEKQEFFESAPSVLLSLHYEVVKACQNDINFVNDAMVITSPGYPTKYPFNVNCTWKDVKSSDTDLYHISIVDLQIYPDHKLTIGNKDQPINTTPGDYVFNGTNFNIKFLSNIDGLGESPLRGFNINLEKLDCGGFFDDDNSFETNASVSTDCFWRISVPNVDSSNLHINVNLTGDADNGHLLFYDGDNTNLPSTNIKKSESLISKTLTVLFRYIPLNASSPATFNVSWSVTACDPHQYQCKNGICMHDEWICNGHNDCGDNSDEELCLSYDCGEKVTPKLSLMSISPSFKIDRKTYNCHWTFQQNSDISSYVVFVKNLSLNEDDSLIFKDGPDSSPRIQYFTSDTTDSLLVTIDQEMSITFLTNLTQIRPDFDIQLVPQVTGKYMFEEGHSDILQSDKNQKNFYTLETTLDQQVAVDISIDNQSIIPNFEVCFYDGFNPSNPSTLLTCFKKGDSLYEVISNTNKMTVSVTNFLKPGSHLTMTSVNADTKNFFSKSHGSIVLNNVTLKDYSWRIEPYKGDGIAIFSIRTLQLLPGESVEIYEGLDTTNHVLIKSFKSPLLSTLSLHTNVTNGIRIEYNCKNNRKRATPTIDLSFDIVPSNTFRFSQKLGSRSNGFTVLSPNYPNQYPLNAIFICDVTLESGSTAHLNFMDMDLLSEHPLEVKQNGKTILSSNSDVLPDDLIIAGTEFTITWQSTKNVLLDVQVGRGFKFDVSRLSDGSTSSKPEGTLNLNNTGLWSIDVQPKETHTNLLLTISKDTFTSGNGELIIYDGGTQNAPIIKYDSSLTSVVVTSNITKVLLEYKNPTNANPNTEYTVVYKTMTCSAENACKNGICMHEDWICNGINECGDFSDEELCVPGECGGKILVADRITVSPTFNKTKHYNCHWTIEAETSFSSLYIQVTGLQLNEEDSLILRDGQNSSSLIIQKFTADSSDYRNNILITSTKDLYVNFVTSQSRIMPIFQLTIVPQKMGKHVRGDAIIEVANYDKDTPETYTLEVESGKQANVHLIIANDSLPNWKLCFYEGFYEPDDNTLIRCFQGSESEIYPIISNENKLLITAERFVEASKATMTVSSIDPGFNAFYDGVNGNILLVATSPHQYVWRIIPKKEGIIVLTVKRLQLERDEKVRIIAGMSDLDTEIGQFQEAVNSEYVIHSDATEGIKIIYECNHITSSNSPVAIIDIAYEVIPQEEFNQNYDMNDDNIAQPIVISSPGYPNQYPVHADCTWTFTLHENSSVKFAQIQIDDVDLNPDHSLTIHSDNKTVLLVSGSAIPDDLILTDKTFSVQWNSNNRSSRESQNEQLGKGFKLIVTPFACGGNLTETKMTIDDMPENETIDCVWIISSPKQYSMLQFYIDPQHKDNNASLEIRDGGSAKSQIQFNTTEHVNLLSSTNKLYVRYTYKAEFPNNSTTIAYKFDYIVLECANASARCLNDKCLHLEWLCDGHNDCGDNTDEMNCYAPMAEEYFPVSGVSKGWLAGGIIMALLAGIVIGVLAPYAVRRIRSLRQGHNYEKFDDANETE